MSEDVHYKLGERLNEGPMKMPLTDAFLDILREYYTEEQAAVGANFPKGAHVGKDLAKHYGRDEKELVEFLETMAGSGLIFTVRKNNGETEYSLTPFVPGVFEFQLMRGTDTPQDRKTARMVTDFMESMEDMMAEIMKNNPEIVQEMMPDAAARTVTVEKELPQTGEIYPYEKLTEMVQNETSFCASVCYCRHHAFLIDEPCKVENVPRYSCLSFGNVAEFVIEHKFGKRISKEECLKILEEVEEAGLVHNANNFIGDMVFVCNCCGCCCGFIKMLKKFENKAILAYSNFEVAIDEDTCSGCEDCIERCQMEALSLNDDEIIVVNKENCIGCGNCVSVCPTECLSMVRRSNTKPPEAGATFGGLGV